MLDKPEVAEKMLIDTDIIIWYMRGNINAYKAIKNIEDFNISVITYMELVQGVRNKNEFKELRTTLNYWNAKTLYINYEVSTKAMFYIERYCLSHHLEIADSLIASTAICSGMSLFTGNKKHFSCIRELSIKAFNPS